MHHRQRSVTETVWLYRTVFRARLVVFASLMLVMAIFLQPLDFVYANEEVLDEVVEVVPEPEVEEVVEEPEPSQPEPEEASESIEEDVDPAQEGIDANIVTDEPETETDEAAVHSEGEGDVASSDGVETVSDDSEPVESDGGDTETSTTSDIELEGTAGSSDAASSTDGGFVGNEAVVASDTAASSSADRGTSSSGATGGGTSATDESDDVQTATTATSSIADTQSTTTENQVADDQTASPAPEQVIVQSDEVGNEQPVVVNTEVGESDDGGDSTAVQGDVAGVATSTASTTEIVSEPTLIAVTTNTSNRHQFSDNECVSVGNGAFYCSKNNNASTNDDNKLIARKDADGDREIYMIIKGQEMQITDNDRDDLAPEYDKLSNTVVWYSMVGSRYQIMQYDLDSKEETQISSMQNNSTEPSIEGAYMVWQYWDGNDWEIVLYDGASTTQITDNDAHDLSPSIQDKRVIWTTHDYDGEQIAKVYDVKTGETTTIRDTDGGTVQNPRFVLVYDAKYDNGDVVTKGFDPETGIVLPLHAEPAELPDRIPDSDSTGETRALLQQKTGKEDSAEDLLEPQSTTDDPPVSYDDNGTEALAVAATTTEDGTLDLQATSTEQFELTEFDLPIPPLADTSSTTQANNSSSTNNLVE